MKGKHFKEILRSIDQVREIHSACTCARCKASKRTKRDGYQPSKDSIKANEAKPPIGRS